MEPTKIEKILTVVSAKEYGTPLLQSIRLNLEEAANLAEADHGLGAMAAMGRAQASLAEFISLWDTITKE